MRGQFRLLTCADCGAPVMGRAQGTKVCDGCRASRRSKSRDQRSADDRLWRATSQRVPLSAEQARALLSYEVATGILRWRVTRGKAKAGAPAGSRNSKGYVQVTINGKNVPAHRLAWLMATGAMPADGRMIDHIDGDPSNNALANLRLASPAQNGANRGMDKRNKSGVKGVHYNAKRRKFEASIGGRNGTTIGRFATLPEAAAARAVAATARWKEFARDGAP